jgi:hypothetical protein
MTGHLFAQFTTTSGTITDGDGTVWFNANVTATFVPNPNYPNQNQYNINGVNLTSPTYVSYLSQSTLTNGTGMFSLTLLDNNQIAPGGSSWKLTIQSYTSAPSSTFPNLAVSGATYNATSFISSNIISPRFPATTGQYGGAFGYSTGEISTIPVPGGSFFNVTLGALEVWTCTGISPCVWVVNQLSSLTCATIVGCGPQYGFLNNVSGGQGISDTTLVLTGPASAYPTSGVVLVDTERELYTGISGGNTLTGITRGYSTTTAATHTAGAQVYSVDQSFTPVNQSPNGGLFGYPPLLVVNCATPTGFQPWVTEVNCNGNEFGLDSTGGIHQVATTSANNYMGPIYIGSQFTSTVNNQYQPVPILNTTNLVQVTNPSQMSYTLGLPGIAGQEKAIPSPTIGALTLTNNFIGAGACSVTYDVTGIDADGGIVPGTPTIITGLASTWTIPASVGIQTPMTAGVVTFKLYRTATSGCGGLNTGLLATSTSQYNLFTDQYNSADGTTAPTVNTSIPKNCIGTTGNYENFCALAGTSPTPPVTCSSTYSGWEYTNTSATVAPFKQRCVLGAWIDAQIASTTGASGTFAYPSSLTILNGLVTSATAGVTVHQTGVLIITSGICTTGTSASATCTMSPVNWPTAFADTNYALTCTPSAPTTGLQANIYATKTANAVTITLQNGQGSAAVATTVGEIDCYGVHI